MAARTTTGNGVVSNATGTNLDGGTALGTTDTLIFSHNITIDASTDCGSSPSTGGTYAIAGGATSGKSLTINDGVTLTEKGGHNFTNNGAGRSTLVMGAGSVLTFLPPSGQQYTLNFPNFQYIDFTIAGTSGSPAVIQTDLSLGGLAAYSAGAQPVYNTGEGNTSIAYLNTVDLGTASAFGIWLAAKSVTNCTFTRSSARLSVSASATQDRTFANNKAASSVANNVMASGVAFGFSISSSAAAVTTISSNALDKRVYVSDFTDNVRFTGNYCPDGFSQSGSSAWTNADYFKENVCDVLNSSGLSIRGPFKRCYWFNTLETSNPHFTQCTSGTSFTDNVYEATGLSGGQSDAGDCLLFSGRASVISVTGNVVTPSNLEGVNSGVLVSMNAVNNGSSFTVDHNTCESGIGHSHFGLEDAGEVASFSSNYIFGGRKIFDYDHDGTIGHTGGVEDVVDPADADYNASSNVTLTKYPPSTSYTFAGNGYDGNWSATPGDNDIALASDARIDPTRGMATWAASKGQSSTVVACKALLAANPALITEATTGLYDWTRYGSSVTGSQGLLIKDNGRDNVTRGAMEYVAASTGRTGMNHRTLRPY